MKRILLIANYQPGVGGISGQVEELYNHLQEDGVDVQVFSTKASLLKRVLLFFRLLSRVRHYDVLHIHGCSQRGMLPVVYGIICGKCWRKRTVVTYHGGGAAEYFAQHEHFVRRWLMRADERIVLSGFLRKVFDQYAIPCVEIPNIVSLASVQSDRQVSDKPVRFISVRHLRKLYNIPCILSAFEQVHAQIPEATLTILGQGPLRPQLEQWTTEHGLDSCVTFVGQVANDRMMDYLSQADIMLSAPHIDNMPVSVLEAMNAGVLVISSRVGGVPFIIRERVSEMQNAECKMQNVKQTDGMATGLLFEDDNDRELAEKMLWAVEHPAEVFAMTQAAKEEVKKYKWENIRGKLYEVYGMGFYI